MHLEGYTVDVGSYGCLLIAPQGLVIGQRVRLINLVNHKECEATVVRHGQSAAARWELGLQLKNPSHEFWELSF